MIEGLKTNLIEPTGDKMEIKVENVNIFVGPNSSGKSLLLNELNNYLSLDEYQFSNQDDFKIIETVNFQPISRALQLQHINSFKNSLSIDEYGPNNWNTINFNQQSIQVATLYNALNSNLRQRVEYYDKLHTLFLDGSSRLSLLNGESFSPYNNNPTSVFAKIYHNQELYCEFKKYIKEAFNLYTYFKINGSHIEFVFSRTSAPNNFDEFSLRHDSIEFLKTCLTNQDLSDGQKSYIGILLQLLAGNPEVIILDEVEAFLHPPLARKLGSVISKLANERDKQIFLSTHNPNIIMGAIQSGAKTNIIRLTYDGNLGKSTIIDSKKLKIIMSHPLIRSTSFLDALFYKNAVVTESDSDRAFYQEINYRLTKFKPSYGIEDCIFLNAQNKQTVGLIVKELRNLGVPTASILDLDIIRDGGEVFSGYLNSVNIPKSMHQTIETSKSTLRTHFGNLNDDFKTMKKNGINDLNPDLLATAIHFLETLASYGQFAVPSGELECWLPDVESHNHGSKWLIKKFENLGFDESSSNYVKPTEDDVWKFMYNIKKWLGNETRLGMIQS